MKIFGITRISNENEPQIAKFESFNYKENLDVNYLKCTFIMTA